MCQALKLFILRARYRFVCRALQRPFDQAASLRIDRALIAMEEMAGYGHGR